MIEQIEALMKAHGVWGLTQGGAGNSSVEREGDRYVIESDGLPQLPFFIELAKLTGVALETITTESRDHGSGCDTCGYGGGTEYLIYVPAVGKPGEPR